MAAAVTGLSPVIITVRRPMRRRSANRSFTPALTTSFRWMTPTSTPFSLTASGVPPERAMRSMAALSSAGAAAAVRPTSLKIASTAPLRQLSLPESRPEIRVVALKGTGLESFGGVPVRPFSSARSTIERPSGVSSASEAIMAAWSAASARTPGAAITSVAMRLPWVMVPVLSSSRVSTSPAASTARPEVASTLTFSSRSMPAMPMAESRPPMVVGIRQMNSAPSTRGSSLTPEYWPRPSRVATAIRKIKVRPASSTVSASSLGVLRRSAPSTMAIIRSRKVLPASTVMRTLIQSETTVVPPVTADRSPPLSRMTGALSPVMAASFTEATPSMISPSEGTMSPASTSTTSPALSLKAAVMTTAPFSSSSLALTSTRWARNASAAALPRPSAMLSAKLANSTVNQSHSAIWNAHPDEAPVARSWIAERVARTATTSVARITGLRASLRGSSFTKESRIARAITLDDRVVEATAERRFSPRWTVTSVMGI